MPFILKLIGQDGQQEGSILISVFSLPMRLSFSLLILFSFSRSHCRFPLPPLLVSLECSVSVSITGVSNRSTSILQACLRPRFLKKNREKKTDKRRRNYQKFPPANIPTSLTFDKEVYGPYWINIEGRTYIQRQI